jgi:hypothetical protein
LLVDRDIQPFETHPSSQSPFSVCHESTASVIKEIDPIVDKACGLPDVLANSPWWHFVEKQVKDFDVQVGVLLFSQPHKGIGDGKDFLALRTTVTLRAALQPVMSYVMGRPILYVDSALVIRARGGWADIFGEIAVEPCQFLKYALVRFDGKLDVAVRALQLGYIALTADWYV